jgi:hypothetical protein
MNGETMPRERLEAFVDGELSPEDAAQVVMHLATSPEDRAYVERLERVNRALTDLYAAPLALPVPEHLRRAILGPEADWGRAAPPRRGPRRAWLVAGVAMAASVAIAIGLSLTRDGGRPGAQISAGPVGAGTPLQEVLERQPSGTPRSVADGVTLAVVGTFYDRDDRPCRELEAVRAADRTAEHAIACRGVGGAWHVELAVSQPLIEDAASPTSYTPAAGPASAALDGALNALGAGSFLSADEESRLLGSNFAPRR